MSNTLKDLILGSDDLPFRDVTIPEWGNVEVRIKAMTDRQLADYQDSSTKMRTHKGDDGVDIQMKNRRAHVVVKCLYDPETNTRIFDDRDAVKLESKNAGVVAALFAVISTLTNLDRSFEEQVEDAEKNS